MIMAPRCRQRKHRPTLPQRHDEEMTERLAATAKHHIRGEEGEAQPD